jgi:DNA-directed RNA polymerase subunit beta'
MNTAISTERKTDSFDAVGVRLASPDEIMKWSHGEVTKPETINYRTQKPEKDGLFDERIFGPTKDWECYCGKYKRIRYKGVVCDKCGVEVTRSIVRRERMAHIKLAVPVTHIWFLRGTPSSIGLLLNLSVRDLERITYFANYIITDVDDTLKEQALTNIDSEFKTRKTEVTSELEARSKAAEKETKEEKEAVQKRDAIAKELATELANLESIRDEAKSEINALAPMQIITEMKYRDLSMKYGEVFKAAIGAEALHMLLGRIDINELKDELDKEIAETSGARKKKALKRMKLVEGLIRAGIKPEWMVLTVLPVIPPDLRPMVQLDGGRFAASDLNDLYRRVINRNNRLKRLLELGAPEVICRNEKRMLQEAVDALIDNNARRERAVSSAANKRKLKSLSDMLKGKQGRFRQNLLGKRVDYSGRSVIVVGPDLKLHQCGLPKRMALELFKPFVISRLIFEGYAHNVKSASRMIERARNEVWDMLDEVIRDKYVLLNRAPTLHRLGIQAFQPVLIEGNAIQIHPLVCHAFNADFDGDQMAVHVPLSVMAQLEAREIMLSTHNLLKPSAGEPVISPTQDIVLGCYYMTLIKEGAKGEGMAFSSVDEAAMAYQMRLVDISAKIKVRIDGELVETTPGRITFNAILPDGMPYLNEVMTAKALKRVAAEIFEKYGKSETARVADDMKTVGFRYSTVSGISIGMDDIQVPDDKAAIIAQARAKEANVDQQYQTGLITDEERYNRVIALWQDASAEVQKAMERIMDPETSISAMITSGARGNLAQLAQVAAMKGIVQSTTGRPIELPIVSNYKEGFSALEYFISTHGARKGLSDTALRTSESGYLTRRLVDVAQDMTVSMKDCGDHDGVIVTLKEQQEIGEGLSARIAGRTTLSQVVDPTTGEILAKKGELLTQKVADAIEASEIPEIHLRSLTACKARWGVCQKCYGLDLATSEEVRVGEAVGVMAAQSIGEPGTQLTMKTFHAGGIAAVDITTGLPRIEEIFEARAPKGQAILSEIDGRVELQSQGQKRSVSVLPTDSEAVSFKLDGRKSEVKTGDPVQIGDVIASIDGKKPMASTVNGVAKITREAIVVTGSKIPTKTYAIPVGVSITVSSGELVVVGSQLTEGSLNLNELLTLLGAAAVQRYIVKEVQQIYASQAAPINDKHIELIVRQMFSRVRIEESGDSDFIPGEVISRAAFDEITDTLKKEKKRPPKAEQLLLPISKVAHHSDSFLSAASFQETTKVLINAAVRGQIDDLRGLKENVIIGRLIPVGTGYAPEDFVGEIPEFEPYEPLDVDTTRSAPQDELEQIEKDLAAVSEPESD